MGEQQATEFLKKLNLWSRLSKYIEIEKRRKNKLDDQHE